MFSLGSGPLSVLSIFHFLKHDYVERDSIPLQLTVKKAAKSFADSLELTITLQYMLTLTFLSLGLIKGAVPPIIHNRSKCSGRHFIFHRKCIYFE